MTRRRGAETLKFFLDRLDVGVRIDLSVDHGLDCAAAFGRAIFDRTDSALDIR